MVPAITFALVLAAAPPETLVVPLPEVVVTGSRTEESTAQLPAAVSVVPRSRFETRRQISLADALSGVPGVFVQNRSGAQDVRVTIRGFGARGNGERSNAGNMRGIRVLTDGVPITEPDGRTSLEFADLAGIDRVEIARSNVSALYGNASGGVVNLRTGLGFERPFVEYAERAGSFGFHKEQGTVGFALGEGRGVLTLANTTFAGWRQHSASSGTQARLRFVTSLDATTRLGVLLDGVSNLNRFPGALTQAQLDSAPQQANGDFVTHDDRRRNRVGRAALTLDRGIGAHGNVSILTYVEPKVLKRSERNSFRDFTRHHEGGSVVFRQAYDVREGLRFETRAGADEAFQDGAILFFGLVNGNRDTSLIANKREGANAAGGFVEQAVTWNDAWTLRGAVRYDNLWYISEDYIKPKLNATKRFTQFTPKGSLTYSAGTHTLFAALGGGVEAPAFNEIDPPAPFDTATSFNPFLEPMQSTTYEIGGRGTLPVAGRGTLRYDVALYQIDVKNDLVPFDDGVYFFTAGKSRRRGVEFGLDWAPVPTFSLGSTWTFMDPKYLEYKNTIGPVSNDFADHQIAGLPKRFGSVRARWSAPAGLDADLGLDAIGSYFADDANSASAPSVTLVRGSVGWRGDFGTWSTRLFVSGENLTDENYVASVFINGVKKQFFEPGLPANASFGLTVAWK